MGTVASGSVPMDGSAFSGRFADALRTGRHEAGCLLEVALAPKGKGDPARDFTEAKQAKAVLTAALKRMNADLAAAGKPKTRLDEAIASASLYPSGKNAMTGGASSLRSSLCPEGLVMYVELA